MRNVRETNVWVVDIEGAFIRANISQDVSDDRSDTEVPV